MIDSQEISIIVPGAINKKETPKCLRSIRKLRHIVGLFH
jgi:hypothetical protein